MKLGLLRVGLTLALLSGVLTAAIAQTGPVVKAIEIRHTGPPAASDALVRANIRLQVGDTYNPNSVNDDVRTLYSTGLFQNVQVHDEPMPGGIKLIYLLQKKPTLTDIRFEGNKKFSDRKLRSKLTSKVGQPLDEHKLFLDAQEIQKRYQKTGYQKTEVRPTVTPDENAGTAVATFDIKEAPKVHIKDVVFDNAAAFTQRKLRKTIKTRRHWIFSWITGSGVLKNDQFEEDKDHLVEFYRNHGYIDFEIKDVKFDYPDPENVIIRFQMSEGRQYRVGAVDFKENKKFTKDEIIQGLQKLRLPLKLTVGAVFTPPDLGKDIEAVRDFYGSRGYVDTWVRPIKNPNTEKGTIDLVYEIHDEDKGISKIEKIAIRGNIKTKDRVIRRELAVAPGEVFDMVKVKRSKTRLEQMGYFDKVEAEPEPTDIAGHKNLVIDVEEGNTGNFELGAGFSSVDALVGFVGYREGNFDLFNPPYFRGAGQKLRIYTQIGTRRKDFQISFTEPWFLGRKLSLGVDLYYRDLNFFSDLYDINVVGTRISLTRALGSDFLIGSVGYTIENVGIKDVSDDAPLVIKEEPSNRLVSKISASLAYDTRNNLQLPNHGQRTELLTELAGPFGGDTDFYKMELRSAWYFPGFFEGHVLEARGRIGVGNNYGRTEDRVPLFDRFFLGGAYNMRGFRYRDVGPHAVTQTKVLDPTTGLPLLDAAGKPVTEEHDEPIGGETYWFGSLEYSIPIIERLRFAFFYDIGNVYEDAYSFSLAEGQKFYNDDWGVGLRLNIPRLGPLRLDYAFPVSHDEFSSGSGRFQFSVGFTSEF